MPKRCSICIHEKRTEIDSTILGGQPLRSVARTYRVSEDALSRHKHNRHILKSLAKAHESREIELASTLLEQLEGIQREALSILDGAKISNDPRVALAAIREVREVITVLARIVGEIKEAPAVLIQQSISLDSGQIGMALEAMLACGAIAVERQHPRLEAGDDERQESDIIEDG